jgi:hypothetical protein
MKLNINLGELDHGCITNLPTRVPIYNYASENPNILVGYADIDENLQAICQVTNQEHFNKISKYLEVGIGCKVTSREGNNITGYEIKEASLYWNHETKSSPLIIEYDLKK